MIRINFSRWFWNAPRDDSEEKSARDYEHLRQAYQPLLPDLKMISQERQPVQGGVADQAQALLDILEEPHQNTSIPHIRSKR